MEEKYYKIDFTKVKNIKHVIRILKVLDITITEDSRAVKELEGLLMPIDTTKFSIEES